MRPSRSRAAALAILALLMLPALPLHLLGGADSARAQTPQQLLEGVLPVGVQWRNWTADHNLYAYRPDVSPVGTPAVTPCADESDLAGGPNCPLVMNTVRPANANIPQTFTRNTAAQTDQSVPDADKVFVVLDPPVVYPVRLTNAVARAFATFQNPPLTPCGGLTDSTGRVNFAFEVFLVTPGGDRQGIGRGGDPAYCPLDHDTQGSTVFHKLEAPIQFEPGFNGLVPDGFQLGLNITIRRPLPVEDAQADPSTWTLGAGANSAETGITVTSPDAFQVALWTQLYTPHIEGQVTSIFPVPVNVAERFSAAGFFAFKTAFGGYDNPDVKSTAPGQQAATTDAKWRMSILSGSGSEISLQDHDEFPHTATGGDHEFLDCDDRRSHREVCLVQTGASGDRDQLGGPSAKVFRMPTRAVVPGSSHIFNYTRDRILNQSRSDYIGGGEFTLLIKGSVRGANVQTAFSETGGHKFTIGGFGVDLLAMPGETTAGTRTIVHQLCVRADDPGGECRPNQGTTFLLQINNRSPRADNFSVSSEVVSCSPRPPDCSLWTRAFSGQPMRGADTAYLDGGNSSFVKVAVTPPPGLTAGSSTVRVTVRSLSSPDQFQQMDLTTQLNTGPPLHDVGLFLFPDSNSKLVRKTQTGTFNFTVWNKGTDVDSFAINCPQGANLRVLSTGERENDEWNGTISLGAETIGCRDANETRALTAVIPPGDTREVRVVAQASFSASESLPITVRAENKDTQGRIEELTATAQLDEQVSFQLLILTDGTANPENPQDFSRAERTLRMGKDDLAVCPNPSKPNATTCQGDEDRLIGSHDQSPVAAQRLDMNWTEFAFYRITIFNDGDVPTRYALNISRVQNKTVDPSCANVGYDTFTATQRKVSNDIGMGDALGVLLLGDITYEWLSPLARINEINSPVDPGKSAVFYLRVHSEWNRHNLSIIGRDRVGSVNQEGAICPSISEVTVEVKTLGTVAEKTRAKTVTAVTNSVNKATLDPSLQGSVVITPGAKAVDVPLLEADIPRSCPPITDENGRRHCRFAKPGETESWFFTASKFWAIGDRFVVNPPQRIGGLSTAELRARGWHFELCRPESPKPCGNDFALPEAARNGTRASGDEVAFRIDVTMPVNATISDFADLQAEARMLVGGGLEQFPFFTVGAPNFAVGVLDLTCPSADLVCYEIHPGDRAVIALNVSNGGSNVDNYAICVSREVADAERLRCPSLNPGDLEPLPTGWTASVQPSETRVSPSRNKTVSVFIENTRDPTFPNVDTVRGVVIVESKINRSGVPGETIQRLNFSVVAKPFVAENLAVNVTGAPVRSISPGGSLTFTVNVTNPAPNDKTVLLRRQPLQSSVPEFVDGWTDILGEACLTVPGRGTRSVSFTITSAADALEGTHVTYPLRADQAVSGSCPTAQAPAPGTSQNFAQALVTATVVGQAAIEVQALEAVKVVPRGGSVSFPLRLRNVGTANDTFFFQARFLNESQALPPFAWSADVRSASGPLQSLQVDPSFNPIVFVNVTAPVNIPQTGVRADIELVVRGNRPESNPAGVRLTAFVQDYDLRLRIQNNSLDAVPGQTLLVLMNMTNAGNGIDTMDVQVDIGNLAGFWNVSSEFSAVTLLNQTSKDIQLTIQVPKTPLPTTGAVVGITLRSRQVESIRPQAEAFGLGSPIVSYLSGVPKTALVTVNLFPYVSLDVDGDREPELAIDRNRNTRDGHETFVDPFTGIIQSVALLSADGDGDNRFDHWIDINLDGRPDRYWDADNLQLTAVGFYPDVNNDGTLEFLYDSDADLAVDRWVDPATRLAGDVIEKDFDGDGNPEFLVDTSGDGRPDKYFDPDQGPRGLVTTVEPAPGGNPQQYAFDTSGGGRPTKVYDRVTGEVSDARVMGALEFVANFWYLVILFLAVAIVAVYLVVQRRRGGEGA